MHNCAHFSCGILILLSAGSYLLWRTIVFIDRVVSLFILVKSITAPRLVCTGDVASFSIIHGLTQRLIMSSTLFSLQTNVQFYGVLFTRLWVDLVPYACVFPFERVWTLHPKHSLEFLYHYLLFTIRFLSLF